LKIRIITSCTGKKIVKHENQPDYNGVRAILEGKISSDELSLPMISAGKLYSGRQHLQVMKGIYNYDGDVDLWILSAAFGLIPQDEMIFPYDATFSGKNKNLIISLSQKMGIPSSMEKLLREKTDITLILLGKEYLQAAQISHEIKSKGVVYYLAAPSVKTLIPRDGIHVELGMDQARKFKATLISLKGVIAAMFLDKINRVGDDSPLPQTGEEFLQFIE
jgi:hypothetical protein